jgi:hypothetical protein
MIRRNRHVESADSDVQPKWFNSPVSIHTGTLPEIRKHIPTFERRPFGLPPYGQETFRANDRLDTIVRLPFDADKSFIPIGVVSKDYALVPHISVLDMASRALDAAKIVPTEVDAELKITEYGERMALSIFLPEKYAFDPGDGHPMALRLECINSVDGSTRFRALMGWFRFICSNGLVVGVTCTDMRRRHVGDFHVRDIGNVLFSGIMESDREKKNFESWRATPTTVKQIALWAEEAVRKAWGFKAAARTYHIARTGCDVEVSGQYKGTKPTTIPVRQSKPVPGAPHESQTLYDVSQVLAWLAKERRDLQEQMEWREQIPILMKALN